MADKITQELTTISKMMKDTLDKYDVIAENYKFMYEDFAKEIFKKGMIVGYNKAIKKAKWEFCEPWEDLGYDRLKCSFCGYLVDDRTSYCPGCGAKMRDD